VGIQGGVFQTLCKRRRVRFCRYQGGTCLLLFVLLFSLLPAQRGNAQSAVSIIKSQIISDYPEKLTFQLSARSTDAIQSITLIYWTNIHSCQPAVAYQELDFESDDEVETEWGLDFSEVGIYPPGAWLTWQWQITDAAGNTLLTEEKTYFIVDTRYAWHSLNSGPITIQWYRGTTAFGQALLNIASQALERLIEQAGITPPEQIWITVYPEASEVQEVAIRSSEWVGGIAFPEYQSIIAAIAPDELDWAATLLPHELAHLTTDFIVFNCHGGRLPTWLSEGLAVVTEGNLEHTYQGLILSALEAGDLPPLRTLVYGFSPYSDEAIRSYGHSGMVVAYLLEQYGPTYMADLLAAIQSGLTADEALLSVYQLDTDGLDAAWRVSLGFEPQPTRPVSNITPTQIPTLALWTAVVQPSATPSPSATLTSTPTRTATPETPQPGPISSLEPTQTSPGESPAQTPVLLWIGIIAGIGLLMGALLMIFLRSRRKK
jgi:hypothetical protein